MKVCLYSPYIPKHFGGGEKYLLDVAQVLSQAGHQVNVAISANKQLSLTHLDHYRKEYEQFLGVSLASVAFMPSPLGTNASFLKKLWWTRQFDVMYYLTDGSLFFSLAHKNILHIQFPFHMVKNNPVERLKLAHWPIKNANSRFTQRTVEKWWRTSVPYVHYPLVDWETEVERLQVRQPKKERIILSVGRFFRQLHSKRQDVLVEMFRQLQQQEPKMSKGWKLVLIGAVEDKEFAAQVSRAAKGLPVEIYHRVSRAQLLHWYSRASIYWHAAGIEIDEEREPTKVEHFGISTVEAMAAGCVPVVVGKGGQVEIMGSQLAPLLWQEPSQAVATTGRLLADEKEWCRYSQLAQARAGQFGPTPFKKMLWHMID